MIKVNLAGAPKKVSVVSGASRKSAGGGGVAIGLQLLLFLLLTGTAAGGYMWWQQLTPNLDGVKRNIVQAQAQKAALEKVIKEDQIYETRKKEIEKRIHVIEGLKRDQISPLVS